MDTFYPDGLLFACASFVVSLSVGSAVFWFLPGCFSAAASLSAVVVPVAGLIAPGLGVVVAFVFALFSALVLLFVVNFGPVVRRSFTRALWLPSLPDLALGCVLSAGLLGWWPVVALGVGLRSLPYALAFAPGWVGVLVWAALVSLFCMVVGTWFVWRGFVWGWWAFGLVFCGVRAVTLKMVPVGVVILHVLLEGWFLSVETPALVRWAFSPLFGPNLGPEKVQDVFVAREEDERLSGLANRWAEVEGIAHLSACGVLGTSRLRPRGAATRRLQSLLGGARGCVGAFVGRRWTPDLPSRDRSPVLNSLLATMGTEAKLLGIGVASSHSEGDGFYVLMERPDLSRELVFPALDAVLSRYAGLRLRDAPTLIGLRSRAADWFKTRGLSPWVVPLALPSAVARAMEVGPVERSAVRRIRSLGVSLDRC